MPRDRDEVYCRSSSTSKTRLFPSTKVVFVVLPCYMTSSEESKVIKSATMTCKIPRCCTTLTQPPKAAHLSCCLAAEMKHMLRDTSAGQGNTKALVHAHPAAKKGQTSMHGIGVLFSTPMAIIILLCTLNVSRHQLYICRGFDSALLVRESNGGDVH